MPYKCSFTREHCPVTAFEYGADSCPIGRYQRAVTTMSRERASAAQRL